MNTSPLICFSKWRLAACLAFSLGLPPIVSASCSTAGDITEFVRETYSDSIEFDVVRKGKVVGRHRTEFSVADDGLLVHSSMALQVTIFFVPVFDFNYESRARWCGDRLMSLSSTVDRNGSRTRVDAMFDGTATTITGDASNLTHPAPLMPTNHWHPAVLQREAVLNTITGQVNQVEIVECTRSKMVEFASQLPGDAACFQYTGDLTATVWYQGKRWVGLAFKGDDGSDIVYRCRGCIGQ